MVARIARWVNVAQTGTGANSQPSSESRQPDGAETSARLLAPREQGTMPRIKLPLAITLASLMVLSGPLSAATETQAKKQATPAKHEPAKKQAAKPQPTKKPAASTADKKSQHN